MSAQGACQCTPPVPLDPEVQGEIKAIVDRHRENPGALISVLHEVQQIVGHLPRSVQTEVAQLMGIPVTEVFGVVTFYSLFTMYPKGKHTIGVCKGTACYVKGAERILERLQEELKCLPGETTTDGEYFLEVVRCLGACGLGPVIMFDEEVLARIKPERVMEVVREATRLAEADEKEVSHA